MNSEITDTKNIEGWILFDAECGFCSALARRCESLLGWHRFVLLPLQTPWVAERLALDGPDLLSEMRLLTLRGDVFSGADALLAIARQIWWARPLAWLTRVPGARFTLRRAYRYVARHRHCLSGRCQSRGRLYRLSAGWRKWGPAVALPILVAALGWRLPGWVWMWLLALALFLAAKWLTLSSLPLSGRRVARRRLLAYLFLWPGMDARAFCQDTRRWRQHIREWSLGSVKTLFGAALLWAAVPVLGATRPLLTGWVGMIGMIFVLHFGLFHLLSLLWRALGVNAKPIMQSPGAATSLSRFWGRSWNAAFSDLMQEHFFRALARPLGARGALFVIFIISGVLHELVISLPARCGYGLPTLYFALQGAGVLVERSRFGQALGLGSSWKGWCIVALVAGAPVFCLFHPPFVHNVILPMLKAIGSTRDTL